MQYVNLIFSANVRWIVLVLIIGFLFLKKEYLAGLKGNIALLTTLFLLYSVMTTIWSTIPLLSGPKSFLQLVSSLSYFTLAVFWTSHTATKEVLNFLWPIVGLAAVAAAAGTVVSGSSFNMNDDMILYQGLSYNPNYLGMLLMICLPLLLWDSIRNDLTRTWRLLAVGVLIFVIFMLLQTVSRASILSASIILLFFFLGRGATWMAALFSLGIVVVGFVTIFEPEIFDDLILQFVHKGQVDQSFFYSREALTEESVKAAYAGGFIGLGHGVSFGILDYNFAEGSAQYGREKGNATLAMVEELGWLGLFLFSGIILSIHISIISAIRVASRREDRIILFLVLGMILALLVHAQFEAWILAPGAAATPVFWAFVGVASELSRRIRKEARVRRNSQAETSKSHSDFDEFPVLGM